MSTNAEVISRCFLKKFLAANANPALAETVQQLKQVAHVPGTARWFESGLDNVGNAFEIMQAAKYKDNVLHVGASFGKKGTTEATDIDVVTSNYALQCKALNWASMTEDVIKKRGDELVIQLEKTIAYADLPRNGGNMTAAIVFKYTPPPEIMNKIQRLLDSGKVVLLQP